MHNFLLDHARLNTYSSTTQLKLLIFTREANDDFKKENAYLYYYYYYYYYHYTLLCYYYYYLLLPAAAAATTTTTTSYIYNLIQVSSIHTQLTKDL